jgi:2-iminoacetate synthase
MATFEEYLLDYASAETRTAGEKLIQVCLGGLDEPRRELSSGQVARVKAGERDVFL